MGEEKTSESCYEAVVGICILVIFVSIALFWTFNDFGRLEVHRDYSVSAYISKKNYMLVPYPDRDKAITSVGRRWCENKGVFRWYMPKVILRDIQNGEELGSYSCLFKMVSKK